MVSIQPMFSPVQRGKSSRAVPATLCSSLTVNCSLKCHIHSIDRQCGQIDSGRSSARSYNEHADPKNSNSTIVWSAVQAGLNCHEILKGQVATEGVTSEGRQTDSPQDCRLMERAPMGWNLHSGLRAGPPLRRARVPHPGTEIVPMGNMVRPATTAD